MYAAKKYVRLILETIGIWMIICIYQSVCSQIKRAAAF